MTTGIVGILLDKDGTILDYRRTWVPINHEAAVAAAGGDRTLAAQLLRAGGQDPETDYVVPGSVLAAGSVADIAAVFAEALGPGRTPPDLVGMIDRVFTEGGGKHSVLIEGAKDAISALRVRGFRLGLATNDSAGGLESSLGRHGLLGAFEFLAASDSGYGAKPGPGMVQAFASAIGAPAARIAVVGDAAHDLEMAAAAAAGLKIGVLTGTSSRGDLAPFADFIVDSVSDLIDHPRLPAVRGE